jgi:branched-chain amino acid transport system ATP-binding protein
MRLEVDSIETSYGASQVLFGVTLAVGEGEVVTLMGRNGMGKTTTLRTIMGLLTAQAGAISFRSERIDRAPAHRIAKMGIGYVPEGRRIFPNLTVRENLLMAEMRRAGSSDWTLGRVLDLFPKLAERLNNQGTQLSGGEQQMLAIGRALMTNPMLLILDEATEGLAPVLRDEIWTRLHELKAAGLAILIVDKELEALRDLADRHYVLEKGEVVWSGDSAALAADATVEARYLGV